MTNTFALLAGLASSIIVANPASACTPPRPPEPQPEGESLSAYQARIEKMKHEYDEWRKQRALNAPIIFISRKANTAFFQQEAEKLEAAQSKPKKHGQPPPPPPQFRLIGYFQPIAWVKGTGAQAILLIKTPITGCGYEPLGDTESAKEGEHLIFFAQDGPISENTLIDAIAIDKITEPELLELVARHRERPGTGSESPEPSRP